MARRTKEQIYYNMSRVHNRDTSLENIFCDELIRRGLVTFKRNDKTIFGKPDFVFAVRKIAIFCDSEFWHGYDWEHAKDKTKSNRSFWITKNEKNIKRDITVIKRLVMDGWTVLRFWGKQIKSDVSLCVDEVEVVLRRPPQGPYRMIDLCAGIGGIRRGFERTGGFVNVLSAEIDKCACIGLVDFYKA